MKRGFYAAAALIGGALLATALLKDPGYVTFTAHGRLLAMSLPAFVLLAILAYFVVRLTVRMVQARRLMTRARAERQRERARRQLARGLLEMSAGQWAIAEETLTRSARESESPAVHYLAAARAAELQGESKRRDECLAKALDVAPEHRAAVLITHAEIYLKHNQLKAALATLEQLDASGHQNTRGLVLMARVYRQLGDWQRLSALEPRLRGAGGVSAALIDELVAQVYLDRLKAAGAAANRQELTETWQSLPKSLAKRADIAVVYARAAMSCREDAIAEKCLRELLEAQWDENAVLAYGELEPAEPLDALRAVEKYLPQRPKDAALLLTCARLCLRTELYGKARSYLEASLAIRPRLETFQLLANLLDQLGEHERASKLLNDALVFAVGRKANLPRLRALRRLERRHGQDRRN